MSDKRPIGIFDSGIGGLTVLKELQRVLPYERFVYFADTANLPYGEKTPEQIIGYAQRILTWMQNDIGAKMVVAACHTSSAAALEIISKDFSIPIIGAICPMVEALVQNPQKRRIGIIATPTSVNSRCHESILRKSGFQGEIQSISCPRFVPLIESGHTFGPELLRTAYEYLSVFNEMKLNTLIYGCTHYPWIAETIRRVLSDAVEYIDPAVHMAAKASQELYKHKILNNLDDKPKVDFYCSGLTETFSSQVSLLMAIPKPSVVLKQFSSSKELSRRRAVNE